MPDDLQSSNVSRNDRCRQTAVTVGKPVFEDKFNINKTRPRGLKAKKTLNQNSLGENIDEKETHQFEHFEQDSISRNENYWHV